ncbi:MAG: hypothetical protein AB7V44_02810 [Pseudonocardia sp.]
MSIPLALLAGLLTAPAAWAAGAIVELRVLVVTDLTAEPEAVRLLLAESGVPHDVLDLTDPARPRLTHASLTVDDAVPHSRYQAFVLPDAAPAGLDRTELDALHAVALEFRLRQLDATVHPTPAVGLVEPTDTVGWWGSFDAGGTAALTELARTDAFADMRGDVPFSPGTWVEIATPLPSFRPLLTATSPDGTRRGAVAGVFSGGGREELVLTFSFDATSIQLATLGPGLVEWLTRGTHLGLRRSWLAVHIDDVLLPDTRWVPGRKCAVGPQCPAPPGTDPTIRMTAEDVAVAVEWQRRHGFRLDLAYNGAGGDAAAAGGTDPLTEALVAHRGEFGWINHTWSHRYLGCVRDTSVVPWRCAELPILGGTRFVTGGEIRDEIDRNVAFARRFGLPIDATELVTGEHSGLRGDALMPEDNPALAGALTATGVAVVAADASVEPAQRPLGTARTVPRHPIDLDFNTATYVETVDQYNWTHTSAAVGGDGECDADSSCLDPVDAADPVAGFHDGIVPVEAAKVLDHVLGNDPRPHYVHQPQLAEDRTLYPVLERVLDTYRTVYTDARPLLVPTMTKAADELGRAAAWAAATDEVRAWSQDGVVTIETSGLVSVPLTVPRSPGAVLGEDYGTTRSGWLPVEGRMRLIGVGP